MAALLRSAPTALKTALATRVPLYRADLFSFTLADGITTFNWTSWDSDLVVGLVTYSSRKPWLQRTSWNVSNTMEVPELSVRLLALNDGFNGGANIKLQIHNGLFDGATFLLSRAFMQAPGATAALGKVDLFGGVVSGIELTGTTATIDIRAKTNLLDSNAPHNLVQIPCNHGFCDAGCTLSRASFTAPYTAGGTPTTTFLPWSGPAPTNAATYQRGEITMTSGAAAGQTMTVAAADSTGLTLAYPLYETPVAGDTFDAFQGCTKGYDDGSGQDCTAYSNTQHWRGFDGVPPPNSAY